MLGGRGFGSRNRLIGARCCRRLFGGNDAHGLILVFGVFMRGDLGFIAQELLIDDQFRSWFKCACIEVERDLDRAVLCLRGEGGFTRDNSTCIVG